jgi:predicted methyltransferase
MLKKILILIVVLVGFSNLFAGQNVKHASKALSQRIFHYLNANYPDEMVEIKQLMKSDPVAARKKLNALLGKGEAALKKDKAEMEALVKQYRKSQDQAVLGKIKAILIKNYKLKIKYKKRVIDNIEAALLKSKNDLERFEANQNKAISKVLSKLKNSSMKK